MEKQAIEDLVIETTMKLLKEDGNIKKIADAVCKYHEQEREKDLKVKLLEREKAEAEKASKNIIKAIEQGIITNMTKERLRELETTIKRLENEINEEKCKNYSYLTREEVEAYLETVVVRDPETLELRKVIKNTFIREIVVYKDKLIITYNFTNNKEPIRVDREETEDIEERSKSASLFMLKLRSPICIAREPRRSKAFWSCSFVLQKSKDFSACSSFSHKSFVSQNLCGSPIFFNSYFGQQRHVALPK